jgi:hypothetical protein
MSRLRRVERSVIGLAASLLLLCTSSLAQADESGPRSRSMASLTSVALWGALQLIPSPLLIAGTNGVGGGARWQVTPLVYSFGVAERPLRHFVVAPVARHSGAVEIYGSPEWTCCVRSGQSGWLGRAGARLYLPVIGRGESLSLSLGGSYTYENRRHGGAAELGLYGMSSIIGISLTVAPWLLWREVILGLALHCF